MADQERIKNGGNEGKGQNPPLSRAEELIQAHPDIQATRYLGDIYVTQTFPHGLRHITVDVDQEDPQRQHPTVLVSAWDGPRDTSDLLPKVRRHGLSTVVKLHLEDNEQVTPEIEYGERLPYTNEDKLLIEKYIQPIPAQELVATARTGLEMLSAYQETKDQPGYHGGSQIVDDTRPDMNAHIKAAYALSALNKVTDTMLPGVMPPAPQNRAVRRYRGAPGVSPAPGIRPAG